MRQDYQSTIFIERIEDVQGVVLVGVVQSDGIVVHKYTGPSKRLVLIDVSEEIIEDEIGKGHLNELGLYHLIPILYPSLN